MKTDVLQIESAYFEANRKEWLKHYEGKVALVHGKKVFGFYDTEEAAYNDGLAKFGNIPMLIKVIQAEDPPISIPAFSLGLLNAHF